MNLVFSHDCLTKSNEHSNSSRPQTLESLEAFTIVFFESPVPYHVTSPATHPENPGEGAFPQKERWPNVLSSCGTSRKPSPSCDLMAGEMSGSQKNCSGESREPRLRIQLQSSDRVCSVVRQTTQGTYSSDTSIFHHNMKSYCGLFVSQALIHETNTYWTLAGGQTLN